MSGIIEAASAAGKRKTMRKLSMLIALVIAAVMCLSAAACGAEPEKAIIGTWKAKIDLTDFMNDHIAEAMGGKRPEKTAKAVFTLVAVFNKDTTVTLSFDNEEMNSSLSKYFDSLYDYMVESVYDKFMSDPEYGYDSREELDEVFELLGIDIDALVEQSLSSLSANQFFPEDFALIENGKYRLEDGKLFISENGEDFDPEHYFLFDLSGRRLKITGICGGFDFTSSDFDIDEALPIVFKKQWK